MLTSFRGGGLECSLPPVAPPMADRPTSPRDRIDIGPSVPRTRWPFLSWLAKKIVRLLGWRFDVHVPDHAKLVVLAGPHTSNVDGFFVILSIIALELRVGLFVKHTAFKGLLGRFLRSVGAIPIDRSAPGGVIGQTVTAFSTEEQLMVALAPEGTRRRVDKWKRGFHLIASGAKVPIVCSYLDYGRKVIGTGLIIENTSDFETDLAKVQDFYRDITPHTPENFSTGD